MEEQIILGFMKHLGQGAGVSFIFYLILQLLKKAHPFFESYLNYSSKIQEIKSIERIEKSKIKENRMQKKPPS